MKTYAANIEWETDGEVVDLPLEVEIPEGITSDDDIADYLSDTFDWLINTFEVIKK